MLSTLLVVGVISHLWCAARLVGIAHHSFYSAGSQHRSCHFTSLQLVQPLPHQPNVGHDAGSNSARRKVFDISNQSSGISQSAPSNPAHAQGINVQNVVVLSVLRRVTLDHHNAKSKGLAHSLKVVS